MIPRIEQKAELKPENYLVAIDWLKSNNFNILYPERIVSSIYLIMTRCSLILILLKEILQEEKSE